MIDLQRWHFYDLTCHSISENIVTLKCVFSHSLLKPKCGGDGLMVGQMIIVVFSDLNNSMTRIPVPPGLEAASRFYTNQTS